MPKARAARRGAQALYAERDLPHADAAELKAKAFAAMLPRQPCRDAVYFAFTPFHLRHLFSDD